MIDDPIVEEVYQARQKILDECGGDLAKWMDRLRAAEAEHPERVVTWEAVQQRRQLDESRQPTER
jgi:hypothetical protein